MGFGSGHGGLGPRNARHMIWAAVIHTQLDQIKLFSRFLCVIVFRLWNRIARMAIKLSAMRIFSLSLSRPQHESENVSKRK